MEDTMMDILPDELQWLEADSLIQEESFYGDLGLPPEEDEYSDELHQNSYQPPQESFQTVASPQLSPDVSCANQHHRFISSKRGLVDAVDSSIGKKTRADSAPEDDDWIRYVPPPQEIATDEIIEEEKIISRFASEIDGDFVPVTGPCGSRVYAKITNEDNGSVSSKNYASVRSAGLISVPINVLLERVEHDALMKALQSSAEEDTELGVSQSTTAERLWVDKYAPSFFTELLSDEHTNREVLSWLKQWDTCVYGSSIRNTDHEILSALRRHSTVTQFKKPFDSGFVLKTQNSRFSKEPIGDFRDTNSECHGSNSVLELSGSSTKGSSPPEQKILLLCGPPGLGKTTLAHIAAKHCGYRVVEINASDERASSVIESKILDVVQMNSVTSDSKPKCLVIDEIDGALADGKGAVEVILKMVAAGRRPDDTRGDQSGDKPLKRKKATGLSRPVICICNDLYTPALRPLRQVAKVHSFAKPTVTRVTNRLRYICNKEGMRVSSVALAALADYTECDIRSCLNTLQFLKKKKESLNIMDMGSQVVGRKDISRNVFDVWNGIFQRKKRKQGKDTDSNPHSNFEYLHSLISNCGDHDLILDGIHENILNVTAHDPMMQKMVDCLDSLGIYDLIHRYIIRTQQMSLLVYQPPIAIKVHRLIARIERPVLEWPKAFYRHRAMLMEKTEILKSWNSKIPPEISRHLSIRSFVQDSASLLLHIIAPPSLKPVALQLLSEKEKKDFLQLVTTMVSYAITYKNVKCDSLLGNFSNEGSSTSLSLEPPIVDFINFKGYESGHPLLALAVRQVLVHEIEKQKILKRGFSKPAKDPTVVTPPGNFMSGRVKTIQPNTVVSSATTTPPNHIAVKPSRVLKKPPNGCNYFDRFRKGGAKGSHGEHDSNASSKNELLHPVLFKFNEGYTNAVKRPFRVRDFFI